MAYLEAIELLDLDHASEYVLMAATLIRIKAQMLLPKPLLEEDEEVEDPRHELVQRLLEYQRFKEAAGDMRELENESRQHFHLRNIAIEQEKTSTENDEEWLGNHDVTLYDLMSVFVDVLKRVSPVTEHTVEQIPVTIEDQSRFVLDFLENKSNVLFKDLLNQVKERIILIVTFVAILELVRNKQVALNQNQPFSEIWIQKS